MHRWFVHKEHPRLRDARRTPTRWLMPREAFMSALQDRVFRFVSDAFVAGRAIDPGEAATSLQKTFPNVAHAELTATITRAANGIGVRLKKVPA